MVPHRLPVGKVEIVNVTCDVLAGDGQSSEVSPCSVTKEEKEKEGKKKKKGEEVKEEEQRGWKREGEDGMRGVKSRGKERINTESKGTIWLRRS